METSLSPLAALYVRLSSAADLPLISSVISFLLPILHEVTRKTRVNEIINIPPVGRKDKLIVTGRRTFYVLYVTRLPSGKIRDGIQAIQNSRTRWVSLDRWGSIHGRPPSPSESMYNQIKNRGCFWDWAHSTRRRQAVRLPFSVVWSTCLLQHLYRYLHLFRYYVQL